MSETKKRYLIIALSLAVLMLFSALTLIYCRRSFENSVHEHINALTLKNEVRSIRLRAEMNKLEKAALVYDSSKSKMSRFTHSRITDYAENLLVLVNPWNELPEDYAPKLLRIENGYLIDRRAADALTRMINDCRSAGNHPVICSAYRTQEYQQELYDNKIKRLLAAGYSREDAPIVAAQSVAIPGTSEHQLGLSVDIIDEYNVSLDQSQENTGTQKWLMANCVNYGFILRYPNGSSSTTGIIYEPWHYRYVGKQAAAEISALGITLEEYLQRQAKG